MERFRPKLPFSTAVRRPQSNRTRANAGDSLKISIENMLATAIDCRNVVRTRDDDRSANAT